MRFKDVRRKVTWPLVGLSMIFLKVVAGIIPFSSLGFFARIFGFLVLLKPGARKMVMANLAIAFPNITEAERKQICRNSIKNMCLTFMEFLWLRPNLKKVGSVVQVAPAAWDLFESYVAKDEGLMVISPHVGNWEAGNLHINASGYKTYAVAKKPDNPFALALIDEGRKLSGSEIIYEQGAAKAMMKVLKRGETVMILIDQNTPPKKGGVFVDFFGLPVSVSRAPMSFARRCKANVLLAGCIRNEQGRLAIDFRELPKPVSEYDDDDELCRDIMKVHEEFVTENPDQYLWLYNRFRYIPSNWKGDRSKFPYYHRVYDMGEK